MITTVSLLIGALVMAAVLCVVAAFVRPQADLASTLDRISDASRSGWVRTEQSKSGQIDSQAGFIERVGSRILRSGRVSPSPRLAGQLRLRGISTARFYGERLVAAAICAGLAVFIAVIASTLTPVGLSIPAGAAILAGLFGWFLPLLVLRSSATQISSDAQEALLVYIDLVVLERVADRHVTEALTNAARVSDNPLFRQIRAALTRAELEREHPWNELKRLGDQLSLPALADIADVSRMQLEGASLSAAFRNRAAELRNAHIVASQQEADRVTQRMEFAKTLPVIIVSAIFVAPPLLRLMFG